MTTKLYLAIGSSSVLKPRNLSILREITRLVEMMIPSITRVTRGTSSTLKSKTPVRPHNETDIKECRSSETSRYRISSTLNSLECVCNENFQSDCKKNLTLRPEVPS
ncbi:hypothetical protein NPIL_159311 [Nephila pilipes]|uniref:Uncharacterized protein n=1 Tax=Nephila pilipes TaxID=299642 RepID=A0A8X6N3N9_NEPPI|nr:hypothetical protein NPIL_159311 [Nephila pilipes]